MTDRYVVVGVDAGRGTPVAVFEATVDAHIYRRSHGLTVARVFSQYMYTMGDQSRHHRLVSVLVEGDITDQTVTVSDPAGHTIAGPRAGWLDVIVPFYPAGTVPDTTDPVPTPVATDGEREVAFLASDVALFATRADVPHVLLIERGWDPYVGRWALPGGHVDPGETTEAAAHRELTEETGLVAGDLLPMGTYSDPGRDPRGRYVSFVYAAILPEPVAPTAGDDASAAQWVPVDRVLHTADLLAFDHHRIITDVYRRVQILLGGDW